MKTLFNLKTLLITVFICNLQSFNLYAQDPELFRTWYLTKVTVNNSNYIPSDYGYYPDLNLSNENGDYSISLADPVNISCSTSIENFQTNPNSFIVNQNDWLCLPENTCSDGPNGPCSTIYGKHAEIYHGITTPFIYSIEQNGNGNFILEITNSDGNQAYYSSVLISNEDFNKILFTLYPNPVTDKLLIESQENISQAAVYNIHGKLVKTIRFNASNPIEINVSSLQNGMYFLKIETENGRIATEKFIKK